MMPATQHDAVLWLSGSEYDVVFDVGAERRSPRSSRLASVADETSSWPYRHDRDLTGFIDGSENPTLVEAPEVALDPGRAPGRRRHDPAAPEVEPRRAAWESLPVAEQEHVIGRTKDDSVELDPTSPTTRTSRAPTRTTSARSSAATCPTAR